MNPPPIIALTILLLSCSPKPQHPDDTPAEIITTSTIEQYRIKPQGTYAANRQKGETLQRDIRKQYVAAQSTTTKQSILATAGEQLTKHLLRNIIPFWYGTPWDFNGHTDQPGKGEIACGYFVSTTLLHAGINLNRYTQAQQSPYNEALAFREPDKLITLSYVTPGHVRQYFADQKLPDGLYFAGLDSHVGYLLHDAGQLYFIHANYVGTGGVAIEPVERSRAFYSRRYYICPLSANENLIRQWIMGEPLTIHQEKQ